MALDTSMSLATIMTNDNTQFVVFSQSTVTAFDHFHVAALDHSPITELANSSTPDFIAPTYIK